MKAVRSRTGKGAMMASKKVNKKPKKPKKPNNKKKY